MAFTDRGITFAGHLDEASRLRKINYQIIGPKYQALFKKYWVFGQPYLKWGVLTIAWGLFILSTFEWSGTGYEAIGSSSTSATIAGNTPPQEELETHTARPEEYSCTKLYCSSLYFSNLATNTEASTFKPVLRPLFSLSGLHAKRYLLLRKLRI
ncbi:hypothetical protein ACX0G9_23200 [Flavitalea flava]